MTDFCHPADLNVLYNDIYGEYLLDAGGELTWDRSTVQETESLTTISGRMYLVGFKCKRTELVSRISVNTGSTAASVAGVRRIGLYMRRSDKLNYDLVASTPNDTTLFSVASNDYTVPFSVPYTKIRGEEYIVGILQVTGTMATFINACFINAGGMVAYLQRKIQAPIRSGQLDGQSDLPSSFSGASVTAALNYFYPCSILLP